MPLDTGESCFRFIATVARPRIIILLLLGVNLLYALFILRQHANHIPSSTGNLLKVPQSDAEIQICDVYPDPGNIAISVKTGATEAAKKLPSLLNTSLSCVRDVMIFSDLAQTVAGHQLHDVLSRIAPAVRDNNSDFDIYRQQIVLQSKGREDDIPSLADMSAPPRTDWGRRRKAPWALDKYKFLPMLEMAYELQPEKDWYVFIEADTYLFWPNLIRWLTTLDPRQKLFFGDAMRYAEHEEPVWFGHGGAGYVLSGPALKEFVSKGVAGRWNGMIHHWHAGDMAVSDALYEEIGLKLTSAAPMFNGESIREIRFGEGYWCQPLVTLHHMQARDFHAVHRRYQSLNFSRLLLRDLYDELYRAEGLPLVREDWDNMSDDQAFRVVLKDDSVVASPHTD